jgi:hypothetical protein
MVKFVFLLFSYIYKTLDFLSKFSRPGQQDSGQAAMWGNLNLKKNLPVT